VDAAGNNHVTDKLAMTSPLIPLASNELCGSVLIHTTLVVIWNSSFSQTVEQLLIVGVTFEDVRCASLSQPESTFSRARAYEGYAKITCCLNIPHRIAHADYSVETALAV